MRLIPLLTAVLLLIALAPAMEASRGCVSQGTPLTSVSARTCDANYDGAPDTFEAGSRSNGLYVEAHAYEQAYRNPSIFTYEAQVTTGMPAASTIWITGATIDHGQDGFRELIWTEVGFKSHLPGGPAAENELWIQDRDNDGAYGPPSGMLCLTGLGCAYYHA